MIGRSGPQLEKQGNVRVSGMDWKGDWHQGLRKLGMLIGRMTQQFSRYP